MQTNEKQTAQTAADTYIARQPILDRKQKLVAYELIYNQDSSALYNQRDAHAANAIVNFFNQVDTKSFLGDKDAFLSFPPNLLMKDIPRVFDEKKLVIQIEDNVLVHPVARKIIDRYSKQGYRLALCHFEFNNRYLDILAKVDMIKIDMEDPDQQNLNNLVAVARKLQKKLIAYNVNTPELRGRALAIGCDYYQGKSVAEMVRTRVRHIEHLQSNFFRLMTAITRDQPEFDEIANLISLDVTLTFSLLKLVNSAYFALRNRVQDVKQALTILGLGQLKQWIYLMSFQPDGGLSDELIKVSFLRASFCQALSAHAPGFPVSSSEAYLLGMFSTLDTLLQVPLADALADLPIADEIKDGLVKKTGACGEMFELCIAYEEGEWSKMGRHAEALGIPVYLIAQTYVDAAETVGSLWNELQKPLEDA